MKYAFIAIAAAILSTNAHASCYGSSSSYTCYENGAPYNVQKYGNTTTVPGRSANGSWSSTSQRFGNTTYQNGRSIDGRSWNQTIQSSPYGTTRSGTDSNGKSFYRTCNAYGCY